MQSMMQCLLSYSNLTNFFLSLRRYLHASCDQMLNEDDCEYAADYGFKCKFCRAQDELPAHVQGVYLVCCHGKQATNCIMQGRN